MMTDMILEIMLVVTFCFLRDQRTLPQKTPLPYFHFDMRAELLFSECKDSPKEKHCIDTEKPCAAVYGGPEPFSEPESKAVSNYIFQIRSRIKIFFSLHSYSQLWLLPWGYTTEQPTDVQNLVKFFATFISLLN